MKPMLAFALAFAPAAPALASGLDHLPQLSDVAPQAVAISPHVPHMGMHYANPAELPTGPIYCVIEGRVVCVEYMFTAAALGDGMDWTGLLPGFVTPPISHIDLEHKPDGVGPFAEPLYQLHVYFVSPELLAAH
ncbi:MAG: hypothetical protein ACK4LQ_05105 [Pararhodobacter sp.]